MKKNYIAFFDSGVGGLTLLRECAARYPSGRYLYFGDNLNAPYGNRPREEILRLTESAFARLSAYPLAAAVLACNTVTAECAEALRQSCPFPVVGVEPAVRPAADFARGGKVLLMATRATLASPRLGALLEKYAGGTRFVLHCPEDLAGQVENNIFRLSRLRAADFIPKGSFDAAVLGCTHYIFLKDALRTALGCPVYDGNAGAAARLASLVGLGEGEPRYPFRRPLFIGPCAARNARVYKKVLKTRTNVCF